jgi:hypothetical protein
MVNIRWNKIFEEALRGMGLLANSNFNFRAFALRNNEVLKIEDDGTGGWQEWSTPSITSTGGTRGSGRNLFDIKKCKLEMDFVVEGDRHSMQVLNAVPLAYTCGYPFSEHVCERIQVILN